ncbi:MAG: hypothetical protein HY275_04170 [Gemmatimonadetes bacterium]|nr:hypothetical protein [Gemmatimonadota bacterium]
MIVRFAIVAVLLGTIACEKPAPAPPPFQPGATVKQVMAEVLEPAADTYWDAVGSVSDKDGTHEHAPSTDEEWAAIRRAGTVIMESGNLLMMPGRARDNDKWMALAKDLVATGRKAREAAEARDKQKVFDAGAEVYQSCTNCHAVYPVTVPAEAAAASPAASPAVSSPAPAPVRASKPAP